MIDQDFIADRAFFEVVACLEVSYPVPGRLFVLNELGKAVGFGFGFK